MVVTRRRSAPAAAPAVEEKPDVMTAENFLLNSADDFSTDVQLDILLAYLTQLPISGLTFDQFIEKASVAYGNKIIPPQAVVQIMETANALPEDILPAVASYIDSHGDETGLLSTLQHCFSGEEAAATPPAPTSNGKSKTAKPAAAAAPAAEEPPAAEDELEALVGAEVVYKPTKRGKPIDCVVLASNGDGTLKLQAKDDETKTYGRVKLELVTPLDEPAAEPEAEAADEPADEPAADAADEAPSVDDDRLELEMVVPPAKLEAMQKLLKLKKPVPKFEHQAQMDSFHYAIEELGLKVYWTVTNDTEEHKRPYLDAFIGRIGDTSGEVLADCPPRFDDVLGEYVFDDPALPCVISIAVVAE